MKKVKGNRKLQSKVDDLISTVIVECQKAVLIMSLGYLLNV